MLLAMTERYLPLSSLSICYEDDLWREHILKNLRKVTRLKIEPELKHELERQRDLLADIEGDQTRTFDRPKQKLMEAQLDKLAKMAETENELIANFEHHIATSGCSLKEELAKLEGWFRAMPRLKLRDYHNHDKLAEGLSYQRVSRKELYEVYAAIIILEKYTCVELEDQDFTDIKAYVMKVKNFLSANWTEQRYAELWDKVLSMPAVKNVVLNKGKQKNTTFNRKLVANILHLMVQKNMFAPTATNQAMAEALEGTKEHSVRADIGTAVEDRAMKSAIEKLIIEME